MPRWRRRWSARPTTPSSPPCPGRARHPRRPSPVAEQSLVDHLLAAVERWPDRPAWTFVAEDGVERTLTFSAVGDQTSRLAQSLRERGVQPGDRVAVMLDNRPEFPLVWFALMRLGAAMV